VLEDGLASAWYATAFINSFLVAKRGFPLPTCISCAPSASNFAHAVCDATHDPSALLTRVKQFAPWELFIELSGMGE
jgi:hypothetical protein